MSTRSGTAGTSIFGKIRRELLCIFFLNPQRSFFLLELVRILRTGRGGVQRELASLVASGLVCREKTGIKVFFKVNQESTILNEMQQLLLKLGDHRLKLTNAVKQFQQNISTAVLLDEPTDRVIAMFVAATDLPAEFIDEVDRIRLLTGMDIKLKVLSPAELSSYVEHHPESGLSSGSPWIFLAGSPDDLISAETLEIQEEIQMDLFTDSDINW